MYSKVRISTSGRMRRRAGRVARIDTMMAGVVSHVFALRCVALTAALHDDEYGGVARSVSATRTA